ncbi:MAG: cupredoxin domain-containing protein [Candidatus Paceibacterota bacterium]
MKNTLITIMIIIVLFLAGWWIFSGVSGQSQSSIIGNSTGTTNQNLGDMSSSTASGTGANQTNSTERDFTVNGKNFSFDPSTITVNKGDTVKITFKDNDGFHDLKVDGYNVATSRINTGGEATVTFIADKAGSFEYYCTVGSHKDLGMKGTLIVQ